MRNADWECIPVRNHAYSWELRENGLVCIYMVHCGVLDKVAQRLFSVPRISRIDLDQIGSFLWLKMDGVQTVKGLAAALKMQYGRAAEPLEERLITYLRILGNNRFIFFCEGPEGDVLPEEEKL